MAYDSADDFKIKKNHDGEMRRQDKEIRRTRIDWKSKIVSLSDRDGCTNLGNGREMWKNLTH